MTAGPTLLAALVAAVAGAGEAPGGVVRPVLTPLPSRAAEPPVRPVRTPLPARDDVAARIVRPVVLRDAPDGREVARLGLRTEFGSPRFVPVVRRDGDWLGVIATELPNGTVGWVRATDIKLVQEPVRVDVLLSKRQLRVVRHGRAVAHMTIGVGAPSTPTPTGDYAVTDSLRGWGPYGCCILALSGHQTKLAQGWTGGDRLAVHGTSQGSTIGAAATLGCLRANAADLRRLLRLVRLGTRVRIQA
jgi:hypothetical protein